MRAYATDNIGTKVAAWWLDEPNTSGWGETREEAVEALNQRTREMENEQVLLIVEG